MSNEWLELGYQIPYQTFLELRSGRVFEIMNLHPLSMFFHHLGWFSSFLVCLWLHLNLTYPPTTKVLNWYNKFFLNPGSFLNSACNFRHYRLGFKVLGAIVPEILSSKGLNSLRIIVAVGLNEKKYKFLWGQFFFIA